MTLRALDEAHGREFALYHGDCVEVVAQLPSDSVDLAIYSPPFANIFVYSDSPRDIGNVQDIDDFVEHYAMLLPELLRVLRPGRCCVVHCSDIPAFKFKDGHIGLRDLSGEIVRAHEAAGFVYHSRTTIWKDPVTEMQRTKALGLLWKQIRKDSTWSRTGMPDYMLVFRKYPRDDGMVVPVTHGPDEFPVEQWQRWASPVWTCRDTESDLDLYQQWLQGVWMDIDQGNTLNVRIAREERDEKHMCPLQLDVIERCAVLWSNPGEVILSPFAGVGSEGVGALRAGRRFVGVELKESYFARAAINLRREEGVEQMGLFA